MESLVSTSSMETSRSITEEGKLMRYGVEIRTDDYVRYHGKEPRGNGEWYFSCYPESISDPFLNWYRYEGRYTDAIKQVKRDFREKCKLVAYLMS